jgi:DNA-binding NarL/FixJ family response regulator
LAVLGLRNKVVARQLDVSEGVVKLHLYRIYKKIGVANRTALVAAMARAKNLRAWLIGMEFVLTGL